MSTLTIKIFLASGSSLTLNGCPKEQFDLLAQPGPGVTILGGVVINRSYIEYIESTPTA